MSNELPMEGQLGSSMMEPDPQPERPRRLSHSHEVENQFIEELRDGTTAMRAEFTSQIERLTTLLERVIEFSMQSHLLSHRPSSIRISLIQSPLIHSSSR